MGVEYNSTNLKYGMHIVTLFYKYSMEKVSEKNNFTVENLTTIALSQVIKDIIIDKTFYGYYGGNGTLPVMSSS